MTPVLRFPDFNSGPESPKRRSMISAVSASEPSFSGAIPCDDSPPSRRYSARILEPAAKPIRAHDLPMPDKC